ncbi:MAG: valine--tRNA ligase [Patescibacteria group bacterium]
MADVPEKFLKPYDPKAVEGAIYKQWEDSGYFNPDNLPPVDGKPRTEPFSIVLPPPNVTGTLHMGSALMLVIEDTLVRFERMRGKKVLWIPGTDSAAIATQARVEKDIQKAEKKSRHDLGREELLKRIDVFVEENKNNILNQLRRMGSSLDWSRYAYTMDAPRYGAVMEAFVRMYDAGLIYRGNRIVNWDPKGQTTISDDEIVYEERPAKLVTFKYGKDFPIAVATTRLETKVGDTAVAVHPDDVRYKEFVGKEYDAVFCGVPVHIKIIADESVDPAFGTGALGVTPAHSQTDWDIAERHNIAARPQVISELAKMTVDGPLNGKKVTEAREIVLEWLKQEGLFVKEETIVQNISTAERTGGIVEPLPKLQWFIDVNKPVKDRGGKSLKELMREPVATRQIEIIPNYFEKTYSHWIDNLRDWCISRQIWFGHRIPAWFKGGEIKVSIDSPGAGWEQDTDVLDTWFSSALWTLSTLGWPAETADLKTYHPTTLLETGYDILPFWVARMILMSQFHLGEIPFKTVYLHGLVRDKEGRKLSKSLGNNVDPLEMGEKFGTDAVRVALIAGMAPGTDSKISEEKIRGYKHFANKVWNITRFVLENKTAAGEGPVMAEDESVAAEASAGAAEVTKHLETYRLDLAFDCIYQFVWKRFADEILEESKPMLKGSDKARAQSRAAALRGSLDIILKTLHPFMPFVTEEIWQSMGEKGLIMVSAWPTRQSS